MAAKNQYALNGMAEICTFLDRNESTVLKLYRSFKDLPHAMPIRKVGGIWGADLRELEEWWRLFTSGRVEDYRLMTGDK